MVEEYDFIIRNSAWKVVPRPEGKSVVGSRWMIQGEPYIIWECGEAQVQVCGQRVLLGGED